MDFNNGNLFVTAVAVTLMRHTFCFLLLHLLQARAIRDLRLTACGELGGLALGIIVDAEGSFVIAIFDFDIALESS